MVGFGWQLVVIGCGCCSPEEEEEEEDEEEEEVGCGFVLVWFGCVWVRVNTGFLVVIGCELNWL